MRTKDYIKMMDKIVMPEELDHNLKNSILNNQKETKFMKEKRAVKRIAMAAACAVVLVGIANASEISKAAEAVFEYVQYKFTFTDDKGEKENVELQVDYVSIDKAAPKEERIVDSVEQASELIGIQLLHTPEENQEKGLVKYDPKLTDTQEFCGVYVSNKIYSLGDLKYVTFDKEHNLLGYEKGEQYNTPIGAQIVVRTDENLTKKYKGHELGYMSDKQMVDLDDQASEAEIYELSKIGVKAVLYTVQTDGPIQWGIDEGEFPCTYAIFVYQGVEYLYYGGVSHDTMKVFLDGLQPVEAKTNS